MDFANSIIINASKETIFAHYADVANWPVWDKEVKAVTLGGLHVGSAGSLQPRSGPRAKIMISELTPNTSFTVTSKLPLCKMQFGHELTSMGEATKATHSVGFSGPLAFLFRRLIGRKIERTLPTTLWGLKEVSEQNPKTVS
ncbi:MAG: SRPBCC family protein [Planktomarina sp.]